jgi:hypothetical protein
MDAYWLTTGEAVGAQGGAGMARRRVLIAAALVGALATGRAAAYDFQVDIGYVVTDVDSFPGDRDADTTIVGATYFIDSVTNNRSAYDLQPFLQQAAFAQVQYRSTDTDWWDADRLDVNAELFMASPMNHLSFRPHVFQNTIDPVVGPSNSFNTWSLDVGYYLTDELKLTLVGALVGYLDSDDGDAVENDMSAKQLGAQYVYRMSGESLSVTADYAWNADNEMTFLGIGGMYYPRREFGLGLALGSNPDGVDNIALEFGYWVSDAVRLGLVIVSHTEDAIATDPFAGTTAIGEGTTVGITLAARF